MWLYIARRIVLVIPIAIGVSIVCFALVYLAPGDPIQSMTPADASPADIALIKSLLDSEGILYFVQGEAFSAVRPLVEPVRFMVAADRLQEAKGLIGGLRLAYGPMAPLPADDASGKGDILT